MSQNSEVSISRIDARIPLAVRDTIDRAAALHGRHSRIFSSKLPWKKRNGSLPSKH